MREFIKKHKKVICCFMAIISILAICINLDKVNMDSVTQKSHIIRGIINLTKSLQSLDIIHFCMFIFIYYFYYKFYFEKEKARKTTILLSIIFSTMIVLGYSFERTNSWDLVFGSTIQILKSSIKVIGYSIIIYIIIEKLYDSFYNLANKVSYKENRILIFIFEKHLKVCIPLILIIIWLPIIILFYPGMPCNDAMTQIRQIYGQYQEVHINIINPEVALNNHHPVLATLILGGFIKFGEYIHNIDLALYLYTLGQLTFLIYSIYYSFRVMKKMNIPNIIKACILGFYVFSPLYYIFGVSVVKDVIFSLLIFNYIMMLIEILIDNDILKKKSYLIKFIIVMFLSMMYRNNGVYTIILATPFLIYYVKNYKKMIIMSVTIPLILYFGITKIIYPLFEISPGSIKEMLSIPFQQTARTLYEKKEYSQEDKEIVNHILNVEEITKKYNPTLSDAVKNTFNKQYKTEELVNYFKVWGKYLLKYPDTYIEATMNNIYIYFYPNKICGVGYFEFPLYTKYTTFLEWKNINTFQNYRDIIQEFVKLELKFPVVGTVLNPAFNIYIFLILMVYVLNKNKKYLSIFVALFSILLVCIAAPCFSTRYALAIIYAVPILIALSIYISRNKDRKGIEDEKDSNINTLLQ